MGSDGRFVVAFSTFFDAIAINDVSEGYPVPESMSPSCCITPK